MPHFQKLLTIRNVQAPEEDEDILQFFREHHDPAIFMERHAMPRRVRNNLTSSPKRTPCAGLSWWLQSRRAISHLDLWEVKRDYLRDLVKDIQSLLQAGRTPCRFPILGGRNLRCYANSKKTTLSSKDSL